jgi:hypothetical protein
MQVSDTIKIYSPGHRLIKVTKIITRLMSAEIVGDDMSLSKLIAYPVVTMAGCLAQA